MIKRTRTRSNRNSPQIAAARAIQAELNGRPAELDAAPPDPDSVTAWMADGNCRLHLPATFFPSDGAGVERARRICRGCPVLATCREHALKVGEKHGIWGAMTARERATDRRLGLAG